MLSVRGACRDTVGVVTMGHVDGLTESVWSTTALYNSVLARQPTIIIEYCTLLPSRTPGLMSSSTRDTSQSGQQTGGRSPLPWCRLTPGRPQRPIPSCCAVVDSISRRTVAIALSLFVTWWRRSVINDWEDATQAYTISCQTTDDTAHRRLIQSAAANAGIFSCGCRAATATATSWRCRVRMMTGSTAQRVWYQHSC